MAPNSQFTNCTNIIADTQLATDTLRVSVGVCVFVCVIALICGTLGEFVSSHVFPLTLSLYKINRGLSFWV